MERFDVFVIGGGGTGSEVAFSLARTSGLTVALAERDKLGRRVQPLRLCPHEGDASIGEDRVARAGRRPLRRADPRGRCRLPGRAATSSRHHRVAVRRGHETLRTRRGPGLHAGGPPPRGASRGARRRHPDRGGQGGPHHRYGGRDPPIPGLADGPYLDESRSDLGTRFAPRVACRDRHRRRSGSSSRRSTLASARA